MDVIHEESECWNVQLQSDRKAWLCDRESHFKAASVTKRISKRCILRALIHLASFMP